MANPAVLWKNGRIVPWEEGTIHLITPAVQYGYGIFEGIRFYDTEHGPAIFRLHDHWQRFFYSAESLRMKIPYSEEELTSAAKELVKATGFLEGYIRPYAGYSIESIGVKHDESKVCVVIAVVSGYKKAESVRVKISKVMRVHPATADVNAKIAGIYVNSKFAIMDARDDGFDDAILLDYRGNVAEGYAANIFVVKYRLRKPVFYTPPLGTILPGITRDTIIKILRLCNNIYAARERNFKPKFLLGADEIFLCGTAMEVMPVTQIDDVVISGGTFGHLTNAIANLYSDAVHGRMPEFRHWLTFVNE